MALKGVKYVKLQYDTRRAPTITNPMIPEWMKEVGPSNCCTVSVGSKRGFVDKTISGILNFFEESLKSEGYTQQNGFLQSIDPRVKLISLLILIVAVSMTRQIEGTIRRLFVDLGACSCKQDRLGLFY